MTISFIRITTLYVMINLLFQANRCWDFPNVTRRVQAGKPVALGEIPYQVGFKTRLPKDPKRYYTFCGGAIIGEAKILSAAHCFVEETPYLICRGSVKYLSNLDDTYAVAGTVRSFCYFEEEEHEQWRTIRNVTYPHNYAFPRHDLALLFVMEPFVINALVKPIRMADRFVDYDGIALMSGYGEVSHLVISDSLLQAHLLLLPHSYCKSVYGQICTSLVGAELGKGDSGGPLVYVHDDLDGENYRTLIGIASGTFLGRHSIFVRVSSYRRFIAINRCGENTSIYYFVVALPLLSIVGPTGTVNNKSYLKAGNVWNDNDQWTFRVVNGWPAKLGDVPYQIALKELVSRARKLYQTFCGATIIGEKKLLSAAHCFEEKVLSDCNQLLHPGRSTKRSLRRKFAVAGNLYNIARLHLLDGPDGQWRTMESVQFPKKYRFPRDDIAVIILTSRFNFNAYINSIPMAIVDKDYAGKCLASGYGRTGSRPNDKSLVLLLAHLTLITNKRCSQLHRKSMRKFVCTSSTITDVGKGDSGGPLVCSGTGDPNEKDKGVLVGVVSGNLVHRGSFFTRVSSYRKFIADANSVSITMYKYNMQSCTAIILLLIYKTFVPF